MTPEVLTAIGWCVAALLGGLHLRTRRRLVLVARASHELRGPLCAARLGLGVVGGEPARVAAIDLELARAGRALDDLAAAPSGTSVLERPELVDLIALARAYADPWTALAAAHGAGLRLELDGGPDRPADGWARLALAAGRASSPATRRLHAVPPLPNPGHEAAGPQDAEAHLRPARSPSPGDADTPDVIRFFSHARPLDDGPRQLTLWSTGGAPAAAVFADPLRIVQAVANLVANAAEHGGGVVRVRVRVVGERVWIEVSDDGPGLPAPVAQLAGAARGRSGRRGHGLAIAAAIAEHHGGRLAAMPAHSGARLVLDLPAARR